MAEVTLDLDATGWHTYSAEWAPERIRFFVDDRLVRTVEQRTRISALRGSTAAR